MNTISYWTLVAIVAAVLFEMGRIAWYLFIARRPVQKFERHNPATAMRILFVGDSTGCGSGTSDACYSLVGRMGSDLPSAHIENASRGGMMLFGAQRVLKDKLRTASGSAREYDLVIIMIGGMDIVYGTPMWLARLILRDVVAYGKQCGRRVVLIGPNNPGLAPLFRFPLSQFYRRRAEALDALYRDIAEREGISYVPLFRKDSDVLSAGNLYSLDKTHPNDEGYGLWYDQVKETMLMTLENKYDRNAAR